MPRLLPYRSLSFLLALTLLILFTVSPALSIGVGMGPGTLEVRNAARGQTYERYVSVMNPDTAPAAFNLLAEGPAAGWVTFHDAEDPAGEIARVTVPAQGSSPVLLKITIPSEAGNGVYNATISAQTDPSGGGGLTGTGVKTIIMARSLLTVEVGGQQVMAGEVTSVTTEDTEMNYPVSVQVVFRNTGNVLATPEVSAAVVRDGHSLGEARSADTSVKPGALVTLTLRWNETRLAEGNYTMQVQVLLAGTRLTSAERAFTVMPVGTFSRSGTLGNLTLQGERTEGSLLKIAAEFANTGQIEARGALHAEVHRDGTLIDSLVGEDLVVPVYGEGEVAIYYRIPRTGDYRIRAYVQYEGKRTEVQEITFRATAPGSAPASGPASAAALDLAVFSFAFVPVVFAALILGARKRR